MVDARNLTVSDAAPGSVEDDQATQAREKIKQAVNGVAGNGEAPKSAGAKKPSNTKIAKSLSKMYGTIGTAIFAVDPACGKTILENAENMAGSLDDLAKENAAVRRVLEKMAETSAWGTVFMAHAPVAMAIFSHHGTSVMEKAQQRAKKKSKKAEPEKPPQTSEDTAQSPSVGMYVPPTVNE